MSLSAIAVHSGRAMSIAGLGKLPAGEAYRSEVFFCTLELGCVRYLPFDATEFSRPRFDCRLSRKSAHLPSNHPKHAPGLHASVNTPFQATMNRYGLIYNCIPTRRRARSDRTMARSKKMLAKGRTPCADQRRIRTLGVCWEALSTIP